MALYSTAPAYGGLPQQRRPLVTPAPAAAPAPVPQPGAQVTDVAAPYTPTRTGTKIENAAKAVWHRLGDALPSGPEKPDLTPLTSLGTSLANERSAFAATHPNAIDTTQSDQTRMQQESALQNLIGAANGTAPSAAVLAGQQAANRAAAEQFGLASALGGRTPGGALRQASMGSANILGQNAADMAAARAGEMAQARGQLVQGLQGVRGQDLQGATDQAQIYNDYLKALLSGQVSTANAQADAAQKAAASDNAYNSSIVGAGTNFVKKFLPF